MTGPECVKIVALIANRCPASRISDYTADSWYPDLAEINYADAWEAVMAVSRRQAFVALHELLDECRVMAEDRAGKERAQQIAIERAREGLTASDLEPPGTPGTDWEALGAQLRARAAVGFRSVPSADPRRPDTRRAEADLELERVRQQQSETA